MNKTLILGAVLATLTAAPALAQSSDPSLGTGNIVPMSESGQYHSTVSGDETHSYAPSQASLDRLRGIRAQAMPEAVEDHVYASGDYVGTDPDPNIRFQLHRDQPDFD